MVRMGTALLRAIREGPGEAKEIASASPLLSPQRCRLFQFYCLHPLASVADAARATGLGDGTVRWHGSRLVESAWFELHASTYYPKGLIGSGDLPLFEVVGTGGARRTLGSVYATPGQSVSEVARSSRISRQSASRLIDDCRSVGLVSVVEDGAFARVYPSRLLAERREGHSQRASAFCRAVLDRLEEDGLSPEVLRRTRSEFHVRFGPPGHRIALDLPVDPFSSALLP